MADVVIDFLMKSKNATGGWDVLHPYTKSKNVQTNEDIEVMLTTPIGSYSNGDTISAGTSIDTIVKKILQQQIPPVYTAPSIVLNTTGTAPGSYEVGTSCSPALTSNFTAGDAGAITAHNIYKNNTSVAAATTATVTHTETFSIGDETVTFKSDCSYSDGDIKNDNFGEPYPSTAIKAGTKTSSEKKYVGIRKYFYKADDATVAAASSDDVRALTASTVAAAAGSTFNIAVKKGQRRATFAYPATLRDVTSVKYVEFNNDESKTFFTKTTVDVEGVNGATAISYKVYTYIPDQAFPSDMTFKVTI